MEMSLYRTGKFDEYFFKPNSGKVVQSRLNYCSFEEFPSYTVLNEFANDQTPSLIYCGVYDIMSPSILRRNT